MVISPDNWTSSVWSHDAVMAMQARLDPLRMTAYADDWVRAVDRIRDVLVTLSVEIAATLAASWRGEGAAASMDALRRYVAGSLDGLAACRTVALRLRDLSGAAGDLRAHIAVPGADEESAARLDEALAQVRTLYSRPAVAAGNAVADIPPPPDPLAVDATAEDALLPTPRTQPANMLTPTAPQGLPVSSPSAPVPSSLTDSWPAGVAGTDRQTLPWHPPTHSAFSNASGPRDGLASGSGVPDRPITSATPSTAGPSPTYTQPLAARASTGPAAQWGVPFLGAAYPGHLGRDDSSDHRPARYLISPSNTNELIGELPRVAPPVIGE